MTVNLTHHTTPIAVASTIADPVSGADPPRCQVRDGVVLSRAGPAADAFPEDHPVVDFLGALLDDLTDDIVPDDETASVLRDAWRRAQVRVEPGRNAPAGGDGGSRQPPVRSVPWSCTPSREKGNRHDG